MNQKRPVTTLWLLGAFCLAGWLFVTRFGHRPIPQPVPSSIGADLLPEAASSTWIDVQPFLAGVPSFWQRPAEPVSAACPPSRFGRVLVIPHYLPLHDRIDGFLAAWQRCSPARVRRVVILSPGHQQRLKSGAAVLAADGYATPLGRLPVDPALNRALAEAGAKPMADLFRSEHGAGVFPVFIQRAFPEASFTPLVLSSRATQAQLEPFVETLATALVDETTLVIVSADFSHYLSKDEADRRDQETLQAFANRQATFFWSAHDGHTDFGRGLWLAWRLVGPTATFALADRINSAEFGGPRDRTTSFFFGGWQE